MRIAISHCTRAHCRASNTPRAPSSAPCGRRMRSAACCGAGVTSIAVPGGKWFTDVTVREAVEGGLLEGPRMVVAGRALSNYGGIFDPDPYPASEGTPADTAGVLCNTRDAFIRETRKQCKRGVDLIKIADSAWGDVQTVADDEISAVVDEAHRHNVKVAIHSRGSTSTRAAAKAGVDLSLPRRSRDRGRSRYCRQGRDADRAGPDLTLDRGRARRCSARVRRPGARSP